jgi:hypothetical protein
MTIEVPQCRKCPFLILDNARAKAQCRSTGEDFGRVWNVMTDGFIGEKCPLKKGSITIKLKEQT